MKNKLTPTRQDKMLNQRHCQQEFALQGADTSILNTESLSFQIYWFFRCPRILKNQKKQPSLQEVLSSIHSNCIRSHAFYRDMLDSRKGEGSSHQNSTTKGESFATFSQKGLRDLKLSIWILLLRTNGSFYSVLALDWTEVFIRCFETQSTPSVILKLPHKCTVK